MKRVNFPCEKKIAWPRYVAVKCCAISLYIDLTDFPVGTCYENIRVWCTSPSIPYGRLFLHLGQRVLRDKATMSARNAKLF